MCGCVRCTTGTNATVSDAVAVTVAIPVSVADILMLLLTLFFVADAAIVSLLLLLLLSGRTLSFI